MTWGVRMRLLFFVFFTYSDMGGRPAYRFVHDGEGFEYSV